MQHTTLSQLVPARSEMKETYVCSDIHTSPRYASPSKIDCATKPIDIDKLVGANESQKQALSVDRAAPLYTRLPPSQFPKMSKKCDIFLDLRAFGTGAGPNEL